MKILICCLHLIAQEWADPKPGVQRVRRIPPNLPKDLLLTTKWTKNGFFVEELRGVKFKRSTFWGGGFATPQKSVLAIGLGKGLIIKCLT